MTPMGLTTRQARSSHPRPPSTSQVLARKLSPVRKADTVFEAFVQYEGIDLHGRSWARWIGNILKFMMVYFPIHI